MTPIPWRIKRPEVESPQSLTPVGGFRGELDRLFDSFFGGMPMSMQSFGSSGGWGPPLDVEETDQEVHVRAEIPGVAADDLEISITGNTLIIAGEKKENQDRKERGYSYQERRYGSFRREIMLPTAVDPDSVRAAYKDGVLTISLRKSQETLPHRIAIKTN